MIKNDKQLGAPFVQYKDTKANIEALTVEEGATAYATDSNEFGTFNGATWDWGQGGGGSGLSWITVTSDDDLTVNTGHYADKSTLLELALPAASAQNSIIRIVGISEGLFRITQGTDQVIHFGNQSTTTGSGGYVESTHDRDALEMICVVEDLEWQVISSVGNFEVE